MRAVSAIQSRLWGGFIIRNMKRCLLYFEAVLTDSFFMPVTATNHLTFMLNATTVRLRFGLTRSVSFEVMDSQRRK